MAESDFTRFACAAFAYLDGLGFSTHLDNAARVRFQTARVQLVCQEESGHAKVFLVQRTSAGPHSPAYPLAELYRWCESEDMRRGDLALDAQITSAAEWIDRYAGALLRGDAEAFRALESLRTGRGPIVDAAQRQRAEDAKALLARLRGTP